MRKYAIGSAVKQLILAGCQWHGHVFTSTSRVDSIASGYNVFVTIYDINKVYCDRLVHRFIGEYCQILKAESTTEPV